nr:hypothetical protein [Tanacetum cinerariifolium]
MEALIANEEAMYKGVTNSLKQQKRQHGNEDKDSSAGPNQGKKTKRTRTKELESSKETSTTKETSRGKAPTKVSKARKSTTAEVSVEEPITERYKFKEGNFVDLYLNDIEDMLLLAVQHKLFQLEGSDIVDFIMALRVIYEDLNKQKRVMQANELYKFSDGILKTARDEVHHRMINFRLRYNDEMLRRKIGAGGSPMCQEAIGDSIIQTRSERDHSKQGRSMIEEIDQDAGVTLVQIDVEDQGKVLADEAIKNAHTYTRRRMVVSTGNGEISTAGRLFRTVEESVSTAGALMPVSTAGIVQEVNIPSPVAVKDKARVEADEELARRLQAEERNRYIEVDQAKMLVDLINQGKIYFLKKLSFNEIKKLFETTIKIVNSFVPMEIEVRGRASDLADGSSQATITNSAEVGSSKRATEAELDYEGSKRQKTNEASGSVQEQPYEEENELSQEDLQEMIMVVPVEEVYVEALQSLVKERFSSTEPTDDKERTLWAELKRLFEPDTDDTLWKL